MTKYLDLSNEKIGYLTVKKLSNDKFDSNGTTKLWECECVCGKIVYLSARILNEYKKKKATPSCGCKQYINLIGKKFGDFIVEKKVYINKVVYWECICCICGEKILKTTRSIQKNINSCSEKIKEISRIRKKIKHILDGMKRRCYSKNNKSYKDYGGRGIIICEEWLKDSNNFYNWALQNGYKEGLSIDRIKNDGNYEPSNCKWSTKKEQNNNKRTNLNIEYKGKIMTLKQWCNELNLPYRKTHDRIYSLKWSIEKAFTIDKTKEGK